MSGSIFGGGNITSVSTVASGAVVLPFTHGNMLVSYVIFVAMTCAAVVLASKLVKNIVTRVQA